MAFGLPSRRIPEVPKLPDPPKADAIPTHVGQDVGSGLAQGNVGIGAPQHFDPNNPSVRLDGTVHNPTGIGGDLHVSREVSVNDLKQIPVPDVHAPDLSLPSGGSDGGGSGGSGFSLPSLPSLPDMPSVGLPDVTIPDIHLSSASMPDFSLPGLPDMPSLPGLPDMPGLPGLPSFGMPDLDLSAPSLPGMPGFRFPDLPDFSLPDFDLSGWDLTMPDLVPDWGGDSEEERAEPHKRAKHQDKVTVEVVLKNERGEPIEGVEFLVRGEGGFESKGELDSDGLAEVEIPRGEYTVRYLDHSAVYARVVALDFRAALKDKDIDTITELLHEPFEVLHPAMRYFDRKLKGFMGDSLRQQVESLAKSKGLSEEIEILWGHAGLGPCGFTLDPETAGGEG
ncbi:MAG: hypothetical protein IPN71_01420 [Fibrobacteres bacterium]|nr:hypothetical protein [Fibrobacterota bacterium]